MQMLRELFNVTFTPVIVYAYGERGCAYLCRRMVIVDVYFMLRVYVHIY